MFARSGFVVLSGRPVLRLDSGGRDGGRAMNARVLDPIRVLVADDEGPIRDAICDLVGLEADMEIAGLAPDADEAITLAQRLQPDVALLDVKMFGGGGRAAAEIAIVSPATKSVAL